MAYFEIYPIQDRNHNLFDTISYVAYRANTTFNNLINHLGFYSSGDILSYAAKRHLDNPHFRLDGLMIKRLNEYCREQNVNLRIVPRPSKGGYIDA